MTKNLFLSYSRTDGERLAALLKGLKRLDHHVWADQELSGGQEWWDEVLKNIRACDAVLFAVSPASLDSSACQSEIEYAFALGKPVLPVAIERIVPDLLPPQLARLQMVDFAESNGQEVFDLVNALQSLPDPRPVPEPPPEQPPVPISYLSGLGQEVAAPSLNIDEQYALVRQLRAGLQRPRERDAVVELMHRLARREDLIVGPSKELDLLVAEATKFGSTAGPGKGEVHQADGRASQPGYPPPQGPAYVMGTGGIAASSGGSAQPETSNRRVWPAVVGGTLVGAVGIVVLLAWLAGPDDRAPDNLQTLNDQPDGPSPVPDEPDPDTSLDDSAGIGDPCLIGEWISTANGGNFVDGGVTYLLSGGAGEVLTMEGSGATQNYYSDMEPIVLELTDGTETHVIEAYAEGSSTSQTYAWADGTIDTTNLSEEDVSVTLFVDGVQESMEGVESFVEPESRPSVDYVCSADSLWLGLPEGTWKEYARQ